MAAKTINSPRRAAGSARRERLLLGLVVLTALGMRVGHSWGQQQHNPLFFTPIMDEQKHHEWAQSIAAGSGLPEPFAGRPFFRAPLYYYLLAGLYKLVGPNLAVARLAGCVLGAATCLLIARLGLTLGGLRVGVIAGLLAAVYWPMVVFDTQLLTVGLELFLNVLLLLLLVVAPANGRRWYWLSCGVVFGLAALARPNILALAPGIVLWLWLAHKWQCAGLLRPTRGSAATFLWHRHLAGVSRPVQSPAATDRPVQSPAATESVAPANSRWPALALLFLGAVITILPVTIRNRIVGGEWVLIASSGGVNFYIGNNPQSDGVAAIVPGTRADWDGGYVDTHRIPERELGRTLKESEVSDYWYRRAWTWIRSDPAGWLRLLWLKFRLSWSPVELYNNQPTHFFARQSPLSAVYGVGFPVVACLGVAGVVLLGREWRAWSLPLLYGVTYLGTIVAFFTCDRYRLPVVPVLILLAAFGLSRLPGVWRERRRELLAGYGVVAGLTGVFLATNPPERVSYFRAEAGQAHHCLGVHYAQLSAQQPMAAEQAVAHLLAAVRLRPGDTVMQLSVAALLQQAGRADLAERQYQDVIVREPKNSAARQQYAAVVAKGGRLDEAAVQYEKLVELEPEALDTRLQLAFILAGCGDYAAALTQFDEILRQQPRHVPTLLNSAAALGRLGRFEEAAERYRRVLQIEPDNADAAGALEHSLRRAEPALHSRARGE
jgi:Tfp pilus assembly protein PilF